MRKIVCSALLIFCTGCTINYVRDSSGVNVDASKDIKVTDPTTTVDGFLAFAKNISDYCSACAKCCRDHKSAVTPENCATYDFSAGWPE